MTHSSDLVNLFLHLACIEGISLDERSIANEVTTLLTRAGENLRLGQSLDSVRVTPILTNTLPQYRVRAQGLVNTICGGRRP